MRWDGRGVDGRGMDRQQKEAAYRSVFHANERVQPSHFQTICQGVAGPAAKLRSGEGRGGGGRRGVSKPQ